MNKILSISKKILLVMIVLIALISPLFLALKNGISIDGYHFGSTNLEKLYIKLDKKLIVSIQNLQIKKTNTKLNPQSIISLLNKATLISSLFSEINIKNINYNDTNSTFLYKNEIFYIDSPFFRANITINSGLKNIKANINKIELKGFNLSSNGILKIDPISHKYYYEGSFQTYEINGKIAAAIEKNILKFKLFDAKADTIENFIQNLAKKINLSDEVKNWIYGYIVADDYYIDSFYGSFNLQNIKYDPSKFYLKAKANNLLVKFEQNLEPVLIKSSLIELRNDNLNFKLENPSFKNENLNGSSVEILNLSKQGPLLKINIKTNSLLNNDIHDILKAYDVDFPITQQSGQNKISLALDLNLDSLNLNAKGEFQINDSNFTIKQANFYSKQAKVLLDNSNVYLLNSNIKNKVFDANVNGLINTDEKEGNLDSMFSEICIDNCDMLNIKNLSTKLNLNFKNNLQISAPTLDLKININSDQSTFILSDLDKIAPYTPLMQKYNITGGSLIISTSDFATFYSKLTAKFNYPIYHLNGTKYSSDTFDITISKDINIKSQFLQIKSHNDKINIQAKNLMFYLDETNESKINQNINFTAKNSKIKLKDIKEPFYFSSFNANIKNSTLRFQGNLEGANLNLFKNDKKFIVHAKKLKSSTINKIFGLDFFKEGAFELRINGSDFSNFKAQINARDTYLGNYKFHQSFLSFLNSVPSLLVFKVPDFNDKGFTISTGVLIATKQKNNLKIDTIRLIGTSADILANGNINLNTDQINIIAQITILKDMSAIIDKIPLVNYILLGRDKTISTAVNITGTIQNPQFETQAIKDILISPYNIVKNVIEMPFNLF